MFFEGSIAEIVQNLQFLSNQKVETGFEICFSLQVMLSYVLGIFNVRFILYFKTILILQKVETVSVISFSLDVMPFYVLHVGMFNVRFK